MVKGRDAFVRGYHGAGTFKKEGTATEESLFAYSGSGTGTFSGTNFFSQAPQSTIFGLEGEVAISGSADESFVPAGIISTVLFDTSGTAAESTVILPDTNKALVRLTGSVSGIKLVKQGDEGTVIFNIGGGVTNVQVARADGNVNLFDITGEMRQGIPVYTPSWVSPLGDQATEEVDWGQITATPTQSYEDWGVINTTDETIPKSAENWGKLLPAFNYVQIGGQHYPNRELTFSTGDSSLIVQTDGTTDTATFLLSEDLSIASAISYESSGITGIATYKGAFNISGANWFSQAQQHTVFGEEGQFTILGTGNESITPFIPEGSGSLFSIGGASESSTKAYLQGDYSYLGGTAGQVFAPHISGVGTGTFSQGREEGQTYARVIQHREDEFGGTLFVGGAASGEKNTDSYNESSIFFGSENETYGNITRDPSFGFGLDILGKASGTETFDDELNKYSQDVLFSNGGLTYDQGSGGVEILPSFDKTNQYDIGFDDNNVSEDYGTLGVSSVGNAPKYDQYLYPHYTGFSNQEIEKGYEDHGFVNETAPSQSRFPYGSIEFPAIAAPKVQYIPAFPGSGTIFVSGTGAERVAVASSTTSLFDFVSGAEERYIAQTPEGTVLFDVSGITTYSRTRDFVGSGNITLQQTQAVGFTTYRRILNPPASGITTISGVSIVASSFDPPEGTYLHIFGGAYSDLSVGFAAQSSKAVMRLSGELNHPEIDYTPHYGIDRNIGIETGITLLPGGAGGEYGDPGIVTTRFIPKYTGDAPILTFSGRSISRTNAPISTHGVIYILGIGTAGNGVGGPDEEGDLEGVEFGAKERFIPATEFGSGSIMFDFTGTAPNRPIKVFGYYGDDNDPGTSGQITIRQEGGILTEESIVRIYRTDGAGGYTYEGAAQDEATTFSEVGGGSLFAIGGLSENKASAELVAGTSIFNGEADVAYSAQTPENTATLSVSGESVAFRLREFDGSGTLTLSNDIKVVTGVRNSLIVSGTLFGLGSAAESIVVPSAASAILTEINGVADTRKLAVFQDFIPSGTFTISGELTHPDIDYTPAYTGSGISTISGIADINRNITQIGVGTATLSGSATLAFSADSVEGTVLFDTKGASAITKLHWLYSPTASGITTISGVGITKPIQTYGYYGDDKDPGTSGTFTFSNTPLVHPEVRYIPSIGIGVAVLYQTGGTALESVTKGNYTTQGFFKGLAGAKESQSRATYVGIGQLNSYGIAQTEYLVIEEGRTYVVII